MRSNVIRRQEAYADGYSAAMLGKPKSACRRRSGTVFFDDWHDGYEEGARDKEAEQRNPAMTTDPTPTACEQVMAALAKMTGGWPWEWRKARFDWPVVRHGALVVAKVQFKEDAAGIVTLKNLAPVLAADYLREKARADAAEAALREIGRGYMVMSVAAEYARAALARKGTQHG